mmetsp:Transcript_131303/g.255828  ORF Transcript_131303/g.255828 Transcript_131303/m.255828 type:complete len:242 (+) Transcript_131303:73-798(+)|eukprot:CAMPEP_0172722500 /NCGR_PEP_ID=MMETSP1074-20121228/81638_1 /TAXON_ID=2916 /ORGANISM="Ceratium fusus, Strain PA161109" /LENGTH=241 /DNA_ID=CAMNT_0013548525 /DNA_START=68 /DNA_END=793 /DNA_ORIENTATION=+
MARATVFFLLFCACCEAAFNAAITSALVEEEEAEHGGMASRSLLQRGSAAESMAMWVKPSAKSAVANLIGDCEESRLGDGRTSASILALKKCIEALQDIAKETKGQRLRSLEANHQYAQYIADTSSLLRKLRQEEKVHKHLFQRFRSEQQEVSESFLKETGGVPGPGKSFVGTGQHSRRHEQKKARQSRRHDRKKATSASGSSTAAEIDEALLPEEVPLEVNSQALHGTGRFAVVDEGEKL